MTIVDIGCVDGLQLYNLKKHVQTHDINVKTVGIDIRDTKQFADLYSDKDIEKLGGLDYALVEIEKRRNSLDKFICNSVNKVCLVEKVEFLLCFGFTCDDEIRKQCYKQMVNFLKPEGRILLDVVTEWKMFLKITAVPLLTLRRCFKFPNVCNKFERKLMTKNEFIQHVNECITDEFLLKKKCLHGITVK